VSSCAETGAASKQKTNKMAANETKFFIRVCN
jgi:hypothetical protein